MQSHLSEPAVYALDTDQDTFGFLSCKHTLMGHIVLLVTQHPHILLLRAVLDPFRAQPVFVLGIALIHLCKLTLGLELIEVHTCPCLKSVKVLVDGMCVDCTYSLVLLANLLSCFLYFVLT